MTTATTTLTVTDVTVTTDGMRRPYAVVPDDRAFSCFPLNRIQESMSREARPNTSVALFNCLLSGALPARKPSAYLVIG